MMQVNILFIKQSNEKFCGLGNHCLLLVGLCSSREDGIYPVFASNLAQIMPQQEPLVVICAKVKHFWEVEDQPLGGGYQRSFVRQG